MYPICICIILYLNIYKISAFNQDDLKGSCSLLEGEKLTLLCKAQYPYSVLVRYMDGMVTEGMPYAVFKIGEQDQSYLISHGRSVVLECSRMLMSSARVIDCEDRQMTMSKAIMHCLPFHADIADELIDHCVGTKGLKINAQFVAMHYVDPEGVGKNGSTTRRSSINGHLLAALLWAFLTIL